MVEADYLQVLKGKVPSGVDVVHDYVQIRFGDSTVLTLNNQLSLNGQKCLEENRSASSLISIIGHPVEAAYIAEETFVLELPGIELTMDLREGAWSGPEALVLSLPGGETIVLN